MDDIWHIGLKLLIVWGVGALGCTVRLWGVWIVFGKAMRNMYAYNCWSMRKLLSILISRETIKSNIYIWTCLYFTQDMIVVQQKTWKLVKTIWSNNFILQLMCFLLLGLCFLSNWFSTHTHRLILSQPDTKNTYVVFCLRSRTWWDAIHGYWWCGFPVSSLEGRYKGGAPYDRYNMGLFDP